MTQSLLDIVEIDIGTQDNKLTVYVNVADNPLSRKWLSALNLILQQDLHLEKNYCWLGWPESARNGQYICEQINRSICAINHSGIGYTIQDHYDLSNTLTPGPVGRTPDGSRELPGGQIMHDQLNQLHRHFEDLQGHSGAISDYYWQADTCTRWHIRQLNLLCHEFESWALSAKKAITAPEWVRPSQLMCWLGAPRFMLAAEDLESFGIATINRSLGGVYVGINKGVSKNHWEVFVDEAKYDPDHQMDNLTTVSLRPQIEAAGDFDIEWANNPGNQLWQQRHLANFESWLLRNGLDPADPALTLGHPQVGQVDLQRSFGSEDYRLIWAELNTRLNVAAVRTTTAGAEYPYTWADADYMQQQIVKLQGR
jgi:hypothetical protein